MLIKFNVDKLCFCYLKLHLQLYKSAGEDVIRLFDLSVIPKNHSSSACDDSASSLPLIHRGRSDSLFSLGTLLYRIAHRLSLSMVPCNNKYFILCITLESVIPSC